MPTLVTGAGLIGTAFAQNALARGSKLCSSTQSRARISCA